MRLYLERIVPVICEAGNDNREYGSSANADINALQGALSLSCQKREQSFYSSCMA